MQAGTSREQIEVAAGAAVRDVARWVGERHPRLAPLLGSVRWARNFEMATLDDSLKDGDEVGLLPPVAGGAPRAELRETPLAIDEVVNRVAGPDTGASVLFVGTVRNQSHGREVARIVYEAYAPMAAQQLERIAAECESAHPGARVAIAHRHGELEVGEVTLVIAAAAPHREAAFAACRLAIESIKKDVAIWKKEILNDGETWVGWGGG